MRSRPPRLAALLVLLLAPLPAVAGTWSGAVTVTSDYVFRGISQSDGHGALQAGVDWSHPAGWFGGAWASTVDIAPSVPGGTGRSLEVDLYAGYRRSLGGPWSAEGLVVRYLYPESEPAGHYDYTEVVTGLHYRDTVTLGFAYTADAFGFGSEALTADVTVRWPLPGDLHALVGAGTYRLDSPFLDGWEFWSLGVTRPLGPVAADLTWFDTDREAERLFGPRAGGRLVLSVGATLP